MRQVALLLAAASLCLAQYVPPGTGGASQGAGLSGYFYLDDATIIPAAAGKNTMQVNSLLTSLNTSIATQYDAALAVSGATVAGEAYLYNAALGVTTIPAGTWVSNIYAYVSATNGGRHSSITMVNYAVVPYSTQDSSTATVTGAGANLRTVTASAGAPFASCVADNAGAPNSMTASMVQLPAGLYQVVACTSSTAVNIYVPTGFANVGPVSFSFWKPLFSTSTGDITQVGLPPALYAATSSQSAFAVSALTRLGKAAYFVNAGGATDIAYSHNGTQYYSYAQTPFAASGTSAAPMVATAGAGGVAANELVATDGTVPARFTLPLAGSCGNGYALTSSAAGGTFQMASTPGAIAYLIPDGGIVSGNLVTPSGSILGRIVDSHQTQTSGLSMSTCYVGTALASTDGSAAVPVLYAPGLGTAPVAPAIMDSAYYPAAICDMNGTPTPTARTLFISNNGQGACRGGTNNNHGYLEMAGISRYAEFQVPLPMDWDATSPPYLRAYVGTSGDSTPQHQYGFDVNVACYNSAATSDDVAVSAMTAAGAPSDVTIGGGSPFLSNWNAQLNFTTASVTCYPGSMLTVKMTLRNGSGIPSVKLYGVSVTIKRTNAAQAN